MAERGAHLTLTALQKPSIFEVVAQQTLSNTIQPALKRLVEFLVSSNPERYGWLEKWFDEVFMSLNFLLQNHYLSYYDGSFSEVFYGLSRLCIHSEQDDLKRRGRVLSLLQLVFLPYMWQKAEKVVQKLQDDDAYGIIPGRKKQLVNVLLRTHKLCRWTWESAILCYYLTYLGGKSRSHSPLFHIFGLALRYSEEKDELTTAWENIFVKTRWFSPKSIGQGFLRILEGGAFILQFLQWWQAEQFTTDVTALPVPAPPIRNNDDIHVKKMCPLCLKSWRLETLLPVSGYVFCYRCIMQYVLENRSCPVTGYPATSKDLVRLYK